MGNSNKQEIAGRLQERTLVGIDLGATNVRVARIRNSNIDQIEAEGIVDSEDPDDLLDQIRRLIKKVLVTEVESIGIGVPSVVDVEKGIVYDVQNIPAWKEVPVKRILEAQFEKPVFVNNDANCFVLGEKYFGKAQGLRSIVGLTLGSGFGGGLVLDGRLYSGENCGAGEVGMLPYRESIFEHYCSGMFFDREYGIPGSRVFEMARSGEEEGLEMFEAFGMHLGNGIKSIMYAYDPQMIVLGGSIRKGWPYFRKAMYEAMQDFAYTNSLDSLRIEVSELEEVAVLGAAALGLDETASN